MKNINEVTEFTVIRLAYPLALLSSPLTTLTLTLTNTSPVGNLDISSPATAVPCNMGLCLHSQQEKINISK